MSLPGFMKHLRVLEDCRLVRTEKVGRVRTCRVEPAGFSALTRWVDSQRSIWERRLDRMNALLDEEDG